MTRAIRLCAPCVVASVMRVRHRERHNQSALLPPQPPPHRAPRLRARDSELKRATAATSVCAGRKIWK